jgi:NitT/TauT family transport system permease protein
LLDTLLTIYKTFVAVITGCVIGIPVGMILGYSREFYETFNPVVDFLRSIPVIAVFPIFLLIFGLSDQGRIALAVFSGSLVITIGSMNGVKNANVDRKTAAKTLNASRIQFFKDVLLFEALPQISTGIKQALSLLLIIVLVTTYPEVYIGKFKERKLIR